jgi:hypothetical protein
LAFGPPDISPDTDKLPREKVMADETATSEPGVVGQTKISYYAPAELAARHGLGPDLGKNLAAIDVFTDALVAPA